MRRMYSRRHYFFACFLLMLLPFQAIASVMVSSCAGQMHCKLMQGKAHCCCTSGCIAAIKKNLTPMKGEKGMQQIGAQQEFAASGDLQLGLPSIDQHGHIQQFGNCDMSFVCTALPFVVLPVVSLVFPSHLQEVTGLLAQDSYISFISDGLQRPPQQHA